MKSISNKQSQQLNSFKSDLQQKQEKLESAIADFNAQVDQLWAELVADTIDEYNKTVSAAQVFVDQTREEMVVPQASVGLRNQNIVECFKKT